MAMNNVRGTVRQFARRERALARLSTLSFADWLRDRYFAAYDPESLGGILAEAKYRPEYDAYVHRKTAEEQKLVWLTVMRKRAA